MKVEIFISKSLIYYCFKYKSIIYLLDQIRDENIEDLNEKVINKLTNF